MARRLAFVQGSRPGVLAWAIAVSAVLHVSVATLPFMVPFLFRLLHRGTDWDYEDDRVIIPISLFEEPAETEKAAEPTAAQAEPVPAAPKPRPRPVLFDAGAPDVALAGEADAEPPADASPLVAAAEGGPGEPSADALGLSGSVSKIVRGKPNVGILIWFSAIREHPLGVAASEIFTCIPQWKEFLGDGIDPIRDLDTVYLFGPRMADTSKVTIVVQTRMKSAQIHNIVSALSRKSAGGALVDAGAGVVAARFRADRAERVAFTHPKDLVIVAPPEGYEQLKAVREPVSLAAARGRAISLAMVTPWRPLNRAFRMSLPETLTDMRLDVVSSPDGGVDLEAWFDDKDAASAEAHAPLLTSQLSGLGGPFTADLRFYASGSRLVGRTHLSRMSAAIVLSGIRGQACPFADGGAGAR